MTSRNVVVGAVDIGGTKIAVGLANENGRVLARSEFPTNAEREFGNTMRRVTDLLSTALRETRGELLGIGIGCTGPIDPFTGILGNVSFFPHWEGCNPASALGEVFGVQTVVENDADAAALGEMKRWAEKKRLISVTVGTGIGVGILLDGHIYRGKGGIHPEVGHHVVDASGPLCSCGARGCWEALASGSAISEWLRREAPTGKVATEIGSAEICARARQGDALCVRAVDRGAFYLGIGIANLINLFAPEVIVLSGGVMKSADLFLHNINKVVRENCRLVPFESTAVVASQLGDDVGLIGAAEVWHYRY